MPMQTFKPHSLFIKKKSNEPDFDLDAANEAWDKLSDSKLTKFVRKAEKAYDAYVASLDEGDRESAGPFHKSLTIRELELLLKYYGLPSKPPVNTRLYYFGKMNQNIESGIDEESMQYKQLDEKWKSLSEAEKAEYAKEYHATELEYNRSFFQFAKTLPETRMVDYEFYLDRPTARKPRAPRKSIARNGAIAEAIKQFAETNGEEKTKDKENPEAKLKEFVPFEIYYEKKKDEFAHLGSPFTAKTKAHSHFAQLSDKKKLKYIREAESRYDAYEFKTHPKPAFAQYLSKQELRTLLKSYNMPEKVLNPSAQYMKDHIKEAGDGAASDRMKIVAANYRNMDEKAKSAFLNKVAEETKKFEELQKKFLQNLPEARKADYAFFAKKKPRSKKEKSPSPVKKSKKSSKKKSKSKSADKHKLEPGQQQIVIVDLESPAKNEESSSSSAKRKAASSATSTSSSVKQLKIKMFKS